MTNIIESFKLDDKKDLVTAAGSGIGRAYAHALAEAGADIAIADIDIKKAEEVAHEVEKIGRQAIVLKAYLSKDEEIAEMMEVYLKKWKILDIAVNNARISVWGNAESFKT